MSLLIDALKQAEARKGSKKPASKEAAAGDPDAPAPAAEGQDHPAEGSVRTASDESGPSLSLAPQDPSGTPGEVSTAAPEAAAAAQPERAASPPSSPRPGATTAASPPSADPAPSAAAKAGTATATAPPRPERAQRPGLDTGAEEARRAAREMLAAGRGAASGRRRTWQILLAACLVLVLALALGTWWLSERTTPVAWTPPALAPVEPPAAGLPEPAPTVEAGEDATAVDAAPIAAAANEPPPPVAAEPTGTVAAPDGTGTTAGTAQGPAASTPGDRARTPPMQAAEGPSLRPASRLRIERARQAGEPLREAWQAMQRNDLERAEPLYRRALELHPRHPDALLGLAVIAERRGDAARAARLYRQVLQSDPGNPVAVAALAATASPREAESAIRQALVTQPRSAALHLALGNLLASQQRWDEAQAAYFEAAVLAPDDPDVLFNLGVALDRLHKPQLALEYYERAAAMGRARPANFDARALAARMATLRGASNGGGRR